MAYKVGEIKVNVRIPAWLGGGTGTACSDGWISKISGEEQFIIYKADGTQLGREDESYVRSVEVESEASK